MMNTRWKKVASIGLCACLALTAFTGCSKKDDFDAQAAAVTVNDDAISAGVLRFATHYLQAQYETMYASIGYTGIINQDIYGTGTTLGDSLKNEMVHEMTQLVLAEQHMDEYDVSLSSEQKAAISEAASAFLAANDEEVLQKMGADQETVERYLELLTIQPMMEEEMAADVDTEVSDEEAAQRRVTYALFTIAAETESDEASEDETDLWEDETASLTDNETTKTQSAAETEELAEEESETEDPATAEAREKAFAKAEDLIARLEDGEDFETAADAVDPDAAFGSFTFGEGDADYRAELLAATDGLEDGTIVDYPVEVSSGYYVIRLDTQLDRDATDDEKVNIVEKRKSDRIAELYEEWEEAAEINEDSDVLVGIAFDFSLNIALDSNDDAEEESEIWETEFETE